MIATERYTVTHHASVRSSQIIKATRRRGVMESDVADWSCWLTIDSEAGQVLATREVIDCDCDYVDNYHIRNA